MTPETVAGILTGNRANTQEVDMTSLYHTTSKLNPATEQFRGFGLRFWHKLSSAMLRLQYGQMVSVLNRLPEEHLRNIGLRRCDIPEYAHKLVYAKD